MFTMIRAKVIQLTMGLLAWVGRRITESTSELLGYIVIIVALVIAVRLGVLEVFTEWLNSSGGGAGGSQ
jgi:hypothetical protein